MPYPAGRYRRPLTLFVAAVLGWIVLGSVRSRIQAGNGLAARYYTNTEFSGSPFLSAVDALPSSAEMTQRWGGRPPKAFAAVWTGFITVGRTDQYRFATTSDDGSRLFVDDRLVVDNGGQHGRASQSGTMPLSRGSHRVRLEYTQFGGPSELTWNWSRADQPLTPVPAWALSQRAIGNRTVIAARGAEGVRLSCAFLAIVAGAWFIVVILHSDSTARVARRAATLYGGASSLIFSAGVLAAFALMPWPAGSSAPFFKSVGLTVIELGGSLDRLRHHPRRFQSNLSVPLAGEDEGVGPHVEQAVNLLRMAGIDRYQLSPPIAANEWLYEQIVASAWPRRREPDAHVRVVLNYELSAGPPAGCEVLGRDRSISLVHCP
jgi:PA14 domain